MKMKLKSKPGIFPGKLCILLFSIFRKEKGKYQGNLQTSENKIAATMVHLCNFSLLAVLCIVLHGIEKISVGGSNSCEVTRSTVQVVDSCPDNEGRWKERAARKNCAAYANQCNEPDKLAYHCVINEYVTQTLELCAYSQYIFLGKCTGYSISGNVIQQNMRTDCSIFTNNPCPNVYKSDAAYKYPDCYKLTKKATTISQNRTSTTDRVTTAIAFTTPRLNASSNTPVKMSGEEEQTENNIPTLAIIIVSCFVLCVLLALLVIFAVKFFRKRSLNKNTQEVEEMNRLNGKGNSLQKEEMF